MSLIQNVSDRMLIFNFMITAFTKQ